MEVLRLRIQPRAPVLRLSFKQSNVLRLRVEKGHSVDWYDGEYVVIPDFVGRTLETESKTMREDVVVNAIPIEVAINESGGNTVTIGG